MKDSASCLFEMNTSLENWITNLEINGNSVSGARDCIFALFWSIF